MFAPITAVAIDDEPAHLLAITTGLSANGIPCTGYWFDRDTSQLKPTPSAGGLPYLRLIFMDLNLAELGGVPDVPTLWSGVVSVLKEIVSAQGGPYLLVFWTEVGGKVADVAGMLYERLEETAGIHCPIKVLELSKGPFLGKQPKSQDFKIALQEFYSDLHNGLSALSASVNDVVSQACN